MPSAVDNGGNSGYAGNNIENPASDILPNPGAPGPDPAEGIKDYLASSAKQLALGNYTDDVTLLGTLGQLALGLFDLDLPGDIRDLTYDLTHWDTTPKWQTALDALGLLPLVGDIKYVGDAGKLAENVLKNADEVETLAKGADKAADALQDADKLGKNAEKILSDIPEDVEKSITEGVGAANPNGIKINAGKQNKHILGTNNYMQSIASGVNRSILKENPQQLLDDFAGTGQRIPNTNKERIDFGKVIGQYYDPKTNTYIDTTRGIIHYDSKGGAHIVPAPPNRYR